MIYRFFLSLVTTTSIFAFGIIGTITTITVINKAGHFLKTVEEEKKDSYKKSFDKFMIKTNLNSNSTANLNASEKLNENNIKPSKDPNDPKYRILFF